MADMVEKIKEDSTYKIILIVAQNMEGEVPMEIFGGGAEFEIIYIIFFPPYQRFFETPVRLHQIPILI